MQEKQKIYFRADGSSQIGLGHVIRSCALAVMLKDDYECHFFIRNPLPSLEKEILRSCHFLHRLPADVDYIREAETWSRTLTGKEIIVLDGYNFVTAYQQIIKNNNNPLVCIDDIYDCHFVADVVINHGGGIVPENYSLAPLTLLYLGPNYALLRPAFLRLTTLPDPIREDAILICMGGADTHNFTLRILEFLAQKGITTPCRVVIGNAYLHKEALENYMVSTSQDIKIFRDLSEQEMADQMINCKYAICPPSTVSYEYLCSAGELYLQVIADNQKHIHGFLIRQELAFNMEDIFINDMPRRQNSKTKIKSLFDGHSPKRFKRIFGLLAKEKHLHVRRATAEDAALYFDWVNDPFVRKSALNTAAVPFETHVQWFVQKVAAPSAYLYVLLDGDIPVGQIRFDLENEETAFLDYSIAEDYRNQGLGTAIIKKGIKQLTKDHNKIKKINALVKTDNTVSCLVFERLTFSLVDKAGKYQNHTCNYYSLNLYP